jgi:subtilisin family serine protease
MKYLIIFCTFFAFSFTLKAKTWITKNNSNKNNCVYKVLNPHLGGDIYQANCKNTQNLTNGEESKIWKLFETKKTTNIEPNDPRAKDQWALNAINVKNAWVNLSTGDKRIKVAVIDTGINITHPDLQDNLTFNANEITNNKIDDDGNGYVDDFHGWNSSTNTNDVTDQLGHGTHVAGIIGASTNNNLGVVGTNWNVSIIPIKFVDDSGEGSTQSAIIALDYAVARGAQIINASWGGSENSPLLEEVIKRLQAKGILFITAAGNETADNDKVPTYPANFALDNIISVASIDDHRDLSWFSNWGEKSVHVAAPGESILSTILGSRYGYKDGTSMAAPYITGAAAILWSAHPDWNYKEVKDFILNHCIEDKVHIIQVQCKGYFSF